MAGAPLLSEIGAVVVLYEPDEMVPHNILSYAAQVRHVIAVDNTPSPSADLLKALAGEGIEYIPMHHNAGIAAALNAGAKRLREAGCGWALTMDQDSGAPDSFVTRLAGCLGPGSDDVAIVAPLWEQVGGLPEEASDSVREIDWAMTSGNLLRLDALEQVGGFAEEFFIDQVDHELCFRLRLSGWRILQAGNAVLQHRQGSLRRTPLGFYVTDYPAIRRYYMTRNTLVVQQRYGVQFPEWLAAERSQWSLDLAKIMLGEPHKLDKLRKIVQGRRDARAGRLGTYEELHP